MQCYDHDKTFTELVNRFGVSPQPPERYEQERELFDFFVAGLAMIQTLCYGLFAIASIANATHFPMATEGDRRVISPEMTRDKYRSVWPGEPVSIRLGTRIDSNAHYGELKEIRNYLAHRAAAPRHFSTIPTVVTGGHESRKAGSGVRTAVWLRGLSIDATLTAIRQKWLTDSLRDVLDATAQFVATNI